MLEAEFRPLAEGEWPGHSPLKAQHHRLEAPFRSTASATFDLLEREFRMLNAKRIVIQTGHRWDQIRGDGWPKPNAADPAHPGVALSFESPHGPLIYATDLYSHSPAGGRVPGYDDEQRGERRKQVPRMAGWLCNLRAIALGLEALRKVDRYGITASGEQYKGWSALPPATAMGARLNRTEALDILADLANVPRHAIADCSDDIQQFYRIAAKVTHPDQGGDPTHFAALQRAYERLTEEVGA